jgi:hypothetical protein
VDNVISFEVIWVKASGQAEKPAGGQPRSLRGDLEDDAATLFADGAVEGRAVEVAGFI